MGEIIIAKCNCGLVSDELYVGFGFRSARKGITYELAFCDHCQNVQSINPAEGATCETCKKTLMLYGNSVVSRLQRGIDSVDSFHCPRCKEKNLVFVWGGVWD